MHKRRGEALRNKMFDEDPIASINHSCGLKSVRCTPPPTDIYLTNLCYPEGRRENKWLLYTK